MKKYKIQKSLRNFKTSFSSPPRKETSYFLLLLTTGDLPRNALHLLLPKNLIKSRKILQNFFGEITTSTLKQSSFRKNPETKMTDRYALI